jgi:hypothetical protein
METPILTYEERLAQDFRWALDEGSMHFEKQNAVHETLRRLAQRLEELGVDYAVVGGMALFYHGFRRFTEDVDVLVNREALQRIHGQLEGRGYVKPFANSKNLRDTVHGVKIDFLISGEYPGDGKPGPIAFPDPHGLTTEVDRIRFLSLEKLIELKLASGRAAHRLGDLNDVQRIIEALNLPQHFAERLDPSVRDSFRERWEAAQQAAHDDY